MGGRARGGRKGLHYSALQEAVVYVFDNLDPEMTKIVKRDFHIKVYNRYFQVTGHRMHTYGSYPINRIQGAIHEKTVREHGWRTIVKSKIIYGPNNERVAEKNIRYLRRLNV